MKTLKESILSSTKTGTSAFIIPNDINELKRLIEKEIKEKRNKCDLNHIKTFKITNMWGLFASSKFNGDISKWDVSSVKNMDSMFSCSRFNRDISKWNVSKVEEMREMFYDSEFNQDISNWEINPKCETAYMFGLSKIKEEYKPKQNGKIIK